MNRVSDQPLRIAVLASGGGSNFGAILKSIESGRLYAEVALLITDRPAIGAIEKAEQHGIPVEILTAQKDETEQAFAQRLLDPLALHGVSLVALAGYLRKVPSAVVDAYRHRMLNVHPSLLPAFGGQGFYGQRVHEAVLAHGCRVSGATIHLVDEAYDTGPIVLQEPIPVFQEDTVRTLASRVLGVEHRLYPQALQLFAQQRVEVEGRRVVVLGESS